MSNQRIKIDWSDFSPGFIKMNNVFYPIVQELKGIRIALEKIAGIESSEENREQD